MIPSRVLVFAVGWMCAGLVLAAAGEEAMSESISDFMSNMWLDGSDMMKILWKDCSKRLIKEKSMNYRDGFAVLSGCIKRKTLKALDRSLSTDVIPLGRGVALYRYEQVNREGKVTGPVEILEEKNKTKTEMTDSAIEQGEWRHLVLKRIADVFNTHVLKVDLQESDRPEIAESRHRRRHQMMHMMMFGIMSMGMLVVPMGFQFLAVLGGKALLLSKLALILSSIQGLKKVATSPLNYGLYTTYPSPHDQSFEKRDYKGSLAPPPWAGDKVAYRFDSEAKAWRPELARSSKKTAYSVTDGEHVYPLYGVFPHNAAHDNVPRTALYGTATDAAPGGLAAPTEAYNDYTIELPLNQVHYGA